MSAHHSHNRHPLLARHALISDQVTSEEVSQILYELERQLDKRPTGTIVEFGCYAGTTSLFLQRLLTARGLPARSLHVFDSFAGLPAKRPEDSSPAGEQFRAGELQVSKATFVRHFHKAGLPLPAIHKSWFSELANNEVPGDIRLAFLDGDFFESVLTPLRLIEHKLAPSSVIIIDDYASEALPGTKRAVEEWLRTTTRHIVAVETRHGQALVRLA